MKMNNNQILDLIRHIEAVYPNINHLNKKTEISNVHLYKLMVALKSKIQSQEV